jgi:hypothetical protein
VSPETRSLKLAGSTLNTPLGPDIDFRTETLEVATFD